MLTLNGRLRFAQSEIDQARRLGIDLASMQTACEYLDAVIRLSNVTGRPMSARLRRVR